VGGVAVLDPFGIKVIIAVSHGVLDVVASRQGLDSQNVIEMKTFVSADSFGCNLRRRANMWIERGECERTKIFKTSQVGFV
jgi:hypothetical protein